MKKQFPQEFLRGSLGPVLALALAVGSGPVLQAQGSGSANAEVTDPTELFFESVDVHVANIEVMVTDGEGNPVTGLTRDDFTVFEDGQQVELTNFFAVENRLVAGSEAPGAIEAGLDEVATSSLGMLQPETRNLFLVIYVDNLNLEPLTRNRAFSSLRAFLRERLSPDDRVMIVSFDGSLEVAQKFTSDTDLIEATLDRLETETGRGVGRLAGRNYLLRQIQLARLTARPQTDGDVAEFDAAQLIAIDLLFGIRNHIESSYRAVMATLSALERFCGSLAGLPGRKAILHLSDGIEARTGEVLIQAWQNKFEFWANNAGARSLSSDLATLQTLPRDTMPAFRRMVEHASAQRVAFYPISNPRHQGAGQVTAEFGGPGSADGLGAYSPNIRALESFNLETTLLLLAEGTGGIAFTRSSNMADLLDRMVADFSTFYSLGYTPLQPGDGQFHRVEVKVRRPGLKARHVRGYREIESATHMEDLTLSALLYDFQDNPLGISVTAGQHNETVSGQFKIPLLIKIPFENLVLLPQQHAHAGRVMAYVVVQDDKGNVSPFKHILLPIQVPNERYEGAQEDDVAYLMDLVMAKGKHRISVGVRDELAKIESTIFMELDVGIGRI